MSSEANKPKLTREEQWELNQKLWFASGSGNNEKVQEWLDEGADINHSWAVTVLGAAAREGHKDTVRLLISKQELDINNRDSSYKRNALHLSCERGHIDCAKLLINAGIDLQATDAKGMNALHLSCEEGHIDCARLLINAGIDLQATDRFGNNAVLCACKSGNLQLVEFLLTQGQSLSSVNKDGEDAVLCACVSGNPQLVEFLFRQGLPLSSVDKDGDDAVLNACRSGNVQLVNFLIKQGRSLSSVNNNGNDAVLNACGSGNVQLVDFLIKQGHSLSSVNNDGWNVMHMACEWICIDMMKYLMNKGIDLDSPKDKDGMTPRMKLDEDVEEFDQFKSQDNTENPTVSTESTGSTDEDSQPDTHLDYAPYLEKAAAKGTVITRQSSLGLCGAAGTGKSSTLRLITGQPPLEQHNSTPMLKPEEYYSTSNDERVAIHSEGDTPSENEVGEDEEWNSDEDSNQPTQSPAKQHQPVPTVKQKLLIQFNENEWKEVTEEELMKRLANWTLVHKQEDETTDKGKKHKIVMIALQGDQDSTPNDKPIEDMFDGATQPEFLLPKQTSIEGTCNELTESILKLMESVKTLNKPVGITHFISTCDTGGQAAFIDIAPAFLRYNSVNLILLKLDENLDDKAQFFYSVNGVRIGDKERQISTRSLIHSFVSSKSKIRKPSIIKGMKVVRQSQKPKFMILGTHFDKYKEKIKEKNYESKEEKNEILNGDLAAFGDCLVYNNIKDGKVMFSLNTLSRDKPSKTLASKIRKLVMDNYIEAEIPIAWYIFQLAMYKVKSSKADKGMIHLSILIEIGTVTKMPQDEVEASLLYFHDLQVCLYFPSVVPNIVFTNPQFLFDKISELIAFTFGNGSGDATVFNNLTKHGKFNEALLKQVCKGFKDDFFSAKDFLSLMSHLFVVCSLPNTDEYFMPCVLATHPNPCKDLSMCSGKPLALTWDKSVPNGLFPSLTTKIQDRNGINNLHFTMSSHTEQYRNKVTLTCINLACCVLLIECTSFIVVFVSGRELSSFPKISHPHVQIRGAVLSCIKDIVQRLGWLPSLADPKEVFLCDICPPCASSIHMCYCDDKRTLLYCDIANKSTMITKSHSIWWTSSDSSIQANSHEASSLLDVDRDCNNVVIALTSVHHKWFQLGQYLNIPISSMESISVKYQSHANPRRQMTDLISTWIRRPTPAHHPCWRVLCQSLSAMGEGTLAEEIAKDHHKDHHHVRQVKRSRPWAECKMMGNQKQFKFNEKLEVETELEQAFSNTAPEVKTAAEKRKKSINEGLEEGQKMIRLTDRSEFGWD